MKLALALAGTLAGVGGFAAAQGLGDGGGKAAILQKYDTNGDGKLDAQERAAMRADFKAKREARKAKILEKYDTNHDGKLEPSERKAMIDDRATARFEKIDANGDGVVTLDEFKAFQESHPMMRHARKFGMRSRHGLSTSPGLKGATNL
ncbi:MAG TPA: EF-hand domain-containing protein [Kofleriaceae bacterium]|nr:EF-hand domain-containing protein [Kofleriaceae bacterium]